jgi:hypothetical protein
MIRAREHHESKKQILVYERVYKHNLLRCMYASDGANTYYVVLGVYHMALYIWPNAVDARQVVIPRYCDE